MVACRLSGDWTAGEEDGTWGVRRSKMRAKLRYYQYYVTNRKRTAQAQKENRVLCNVIPNSTWSELSFVGKNKSALHAYIDGVESIVNCVQRPSK